MQFSLSNHSRGHMLPRAYLCVHGDGDNQTTGEKRSKNAEDVIKHSKVLLRLRTLLRAGPPSSGARAWRACEICVIDVCLDTASSR